MINMINTRTESKAPAQNQKCSECQNLVVVSCDIVIVKISRTCVQQG